MIRTAAVLSAAVAGLIFSAPAKADVFTDLSIRIGVNSPRPAVERVWVGPVYETRVDRVWIEPAYETRITRIWHEAVYEDRCERVLVPDRYETRTEVSRDYHGRTYRTQVRVLVEPAHYVTQSSRVLVHEGCWENVSQQVCISEGHWAETSRQVCLSDGHWIEAPIACAAPSSDVRFEYERTTLRERDDRRDDRRSYDRRDDDRHEPAARMSRDHERYASSRDDRPREDRGRRY